MPEWPVWVWVIIIVVVLAVIIAAIVAATRGREGARIERADDLRQRAHENDRLLAARQERAEDLTTRAEAVRQDALTETERAEELRQAAAEAEERAALAAEEAELRDDEARHSRHALDELEREREEKLRKADEIDPRVRDSGQHDADHERHAPQDHDRRDDVHLDDEADHTAHHDHGTPDAARPDHDVPQTDDHRERHGHRGVGDIADDVPRDEHGRRLDPYGNPVPEDR